MVDKLKVINFMQDFGCAKLIHLQTLFNDTSNNFKNILMNNIVSKKNDIFIYNNCKVDEKMLAALDILCKYKKRLNKYYIGYQPVYITFLTKDNTMYQIIVADKLNEKGVVKQINNPTCLPDSDKYILAFQDGKQLKNIHTSKPFLYCIYPSLEIKQVL